MFLNYVNGQWSIDEKNINAAAEIKEPIISENGNEYALGRFNSVFSHKT